MERTFAYVPYLDTQTLLRLGVDDYVFYERADGSALESVSLFLELRQEGRGVYLVLGREVNSSTDPGQGYEEIRGKIASFADYVDGFILWDDPLSNGGAQIRNLIAGGLRERFPNVTLGAGLDPQSLTRGERLALSGGDMTPLGGLNLSSYDFVVPYNYGWIEATEWDMSMVREMQGAYDSGVTYWLWHAVWGAQRMGETFGPDVWFMLNAHSQKSKDSSVVYTTTTTQMLWDLMVVREAGTKNVGWFTFDGSEYFGDPIKSRPDGWIRYYFLKDSLVSIAKMASPSALSSTLDRQGEEIISINRSVATAIEAAMTTIESHLQALERELNSTTEELGDVNTNLAALRYAMTQLEDLSMGLSTAMAEESQRLSGRISALNGTLRAELASLRQNIESAIRANYEEIDSGIAKLDDALVDLRAQLDSLRREIDGALGELVRSATVRHAELSRALEVLSEKVGTMAAGQADSAVQIAGLHSDLDHLKETLRSGIQIGEEAGKAVEENRNRTEELINALNATWRAGQEEMASRISSLSEELSDLERRNRELTFLLYLTLLIIGGVLLLAAMILRRLGPSV